MLGKQELSQQGEMCAGPERCCGAAEGGAANVEGCGAWVTGSRGAGVRAAA